MPGALYLKAVRSYLLSRTVVSWSLRSAVLERLVRITVGDIKVPILQAAQFLKFPELEFCWPENCRAYCSMKLHNYKWQKCFCWRKQFSSFAIWCQEGTWQLRFWNRVLLKRNHSVLWYVECRRVETLCGAVIILNCRHQMRQNLQL